MTKETCCKICNEPLTGKKLSNHVRKEHGLSSLDYTVNHILQGVRPKCPVCGEETRYTSFTFMKYCVAHASFAESEAGRKGGKAPAWNRGKKSIEDNRILRLSGESNPFWGKSHSEETKIKISETKRLKPHTLQDRISARMSSFSLVTPVENYESRQGQYLEFECNECKTVNRKTLDRKSTRLNSSHMSESRMPSSA